MDIVTPQGPVTGRGEGRGLPGSWSVRTSNLGFCERRQEEATGGPGARASHSLGMDIGLDPQISGETRKWTRSTHGLGLDFILGNREDVTHPSWSTLLPCWQRSHPTDVKLLGQGRSIPRLCQSWLQPRGQLWGGERETQTIGGSRRAS